MTKLFAAIAVVLGALLATGLPSSLTADQTGHTIIASLTPPTRLSGINAVLTCGWHPGDAGCGTQTSGAALDWDDAAGDSGWYFRGFFSTSNASGGAVVRGQPLVNQTGPEICERMTVWVIEFHHGTLRAAPIYTHTNITNSAEFTVSGTFFGTYHNRQIGNLVNDVGRECAFRNGELNVHEWHTPVNSSTTLSRNTSKYPTASVCGINHISCGSFRNSLAANWTRRFTWAEGAP